MRMLHAMINRGLLKQYVAAFAACQSILVSGACFGWITPILTRLSGPDGAVPMTEEEEGWVVAIIEPGGWASPIIAGALTASLGRKPVILASAPLYVVSWLMVLWLRTPLWLGLARFLQGFAMGFVFAVTPIYLGEIATDSARGFVTGMFFIFWWLGIVLAYAVGPYLSFATFTWFALLLNVPFVLTFLWQPESPYYYMMKGDLTGAKASLKRLRKPDADVERELEEIWAGVTAMTNKPRLFTELFATAGDRRALCLLLVANAVRILSGTGATLVYATEIFDMTSESLPIPSHLVTLTLGLVMLFGGLVGSLVSDSVGRRPLIMFSSIGCFICQFGAATYYYLLFETDLQVAPYGWFAPLAVLVYSCLVSVGLYPVCCSYTSELFTTDKRGYASSLSSLNIVILSFIMLATYTPVKVNLGVHVNFYMDAAVTFIGIFYFYFYAIETKGKSFAQIRNELNKAN